MRYCPACNWINPDQDHYCRHCGYFLRHQRRPQLVSLAVKPSGLRLIWQIICRFPWIKFLLFVCMATVLGFGGYLGWLWIQPLLHHPPTPEFEPAVPFAHHSPTPAPPLR